MVWDHLIVGAGISGLTLAYRLREQNRSVLVLEKSKGVGGRMATRRSTTCTWDHGAQFYRVRSGKPAPSWHSTWIEHQVSRKWEQSGMVPPKADSSFELFVGSQGMTSLAKDLAKFLGPNGIQFDQKVISLERATTDHVPMWQVTCENEVAFQAKSVWISAPLPQALDVVRTAKVKIPSSLEEIHYAKALVGLIEISPSQANKVCQWMKTGYIEKVSPEVFSISNQQDKGISQALALTVVFSPAFSERHFENSELEILLQIRQALATCGLGDDEIQSIQLKKWRYSHPQSLSHEPFAALESVPRLVLLGDAFGGPSVSGAIRSAEAAAALTRED